MLQSNYIPWKGNFDMIAQADAYVIYDEVQYTKDDWRNRNKIKTASGETIWLTIPVSHKSSDQLIEETCVVDHRWKRKHWKTLSVNYARAPFFREYSEAVEALYESCQDSRLSSINRHFLEGICEILGIDTPIHDSREFSLQGDRIGRIIDLCEKTKADTFLAGPAAKSYWDYTPFDERGIQVEWMDYTGYNEYPQVAGPFDHAVSVLDLIFNVGPKAREFMKA